MTNVGQIGVTNYGACAPSYSTQKMPFRGNEPTAPQAEEPKKSHTGLLIGALAALAVGGIYIAKKGKGAKATDVFTEAKTNISKLIQEKEAAQVKVSEAIKEKASASGEDAKNAQEKVDNAIKEAKAAKENLRTAYDDYGNLQAAQKFEKSE